MTASTPASGVRRGEPVGEWLEAGAGSTSPAATSLPDDGPGRTD